MPTVAEILKSSGFSDDQIKALDAKALSAFEGVLTTADRDRQTAEKERVDAAAARDAAELAQRSNVEFYETKIAPSLTTWEEEKQRFENDRARSAAEVAYYRTQNEEAKKSGFIATDAPGFDAAKFAATQPRDPAGRYVAGAPGGTPGSPTFDVQKIYERAGDAVGVIADLQWEHTRLFGQPMPISPTELIRQADAVKLDPKTYASRTFNWDARRQQMQQEDEKKNREKIAAEAVAPFELKLKEADELRKKEVAERDRYWAERTGNNPDVRPTVPSKYAEHMRAVNDKTQPNPLDLNDQQRRALTSQMIRKDMSDSQVQ